MGVLGRTAGTQGRGGPLRWKPLGRRGRPGCRRRQSVRKAWSLARNVPPLARNAGSLARQAKSHGVDACEPRSRGEKPRRRCPEHRRRCSPPSTARQKAPAAMPTSSGVGAKSLAADAREPRRRCSPPSTARQKAPASMPGSSGAGAKSLAADAREHRRRCSPASTAGQKAPATMPGSPDAGAKRSGADAWGAAGRAGAVRHRCAGLVIGAAAWMERLQPWQGPPCAERRRGPVPPQRALPPRCGYHGLRTAIIHIGAATPYIPA